MEPYSLAFTSQVAGGQFLSGSYWVHLDKVGAVLTGQLLYFFLFLLSADRNPLPQRQLLGRHRVYDIICGRSVPKESKRLNSQIFSFIADHVRGSCSKMFPL